MGPSVWAGGKICVGDKVVFQKMFGIPIKCNNSSAEEHFIIQKEHVLGKMIE
jgi:co-chaperonin GroES (HSP10)